MEVMEGAAILVIKAVTIRNMDKTPLIMVEGEGGLTSMPFISNREILHRTRTSMPRRLLLPHHHRGTTSKDGSSLEDTNNNIHLRTSIQGFKVPHRLLLLPDRATISVVRYKTTLNRMLVIHLTGIMQDQIISKEHRRIRV
jgi:hypothetical protein